MEISHPRTRGARHLVATHNNVTVRRFFFFFGLCWFNCVDDSHPAVLCSPPVTLDCYLSALLERSILWWQIESSRVPLGLSSSSRTAVKYRRVFLYTCGREMLGRRSWAHSLVSLFLFFNIPLYLVKCIETISSYREDVMMAAGNCIATVSSRLLTTALPSLNTLMYLVRPSLLSLPKASHPPPPLCVYLTFCLTVKLSLCLSWVLTVKRTMCLWSHQ